MAGGYALPCRACRETCTIQASAPAERALGRRFLFFLILLVVLFLLFVLRYAYGRIGLAPQYFFVVLCFSSLCWAAI